MFVTIEKMKNTEKSQNLLTSRGRRIAEVRKRVLHVSQEKLANQVGVKMRTIQRYESDETPVPESFYQKLSEINRFINVEWIRTGVGSLYNLTDPTSNFFLDYESIRTKVNEDDYKQKLQLAIAEINMLRAALIYKDNLLNVLVNQSVVF
ncbi:MAG: helix-turn-helix domain-containing protein [Bacteroidia bacterium]|nr:helix-turn-helix domain-containing protein [Bacteroidia bacterium]